VQIFAFFYFLVSFLCNSKKSPSFFFKFHQTTIMFISVSEALTTDSTESNISNCFNGSHYFFEAMPVLMKNDSKFEMLSAKQQQRGTESVMASNPSSMSLGAGPLWWS
jgi:hypothetical protein